MQEEMVTPEAAPQTNADEYAPVEITFPEGLVGCHEWHQFLLLEAEGAGPIKLLQCVDDPDVGFYVTDPYLIVEDYELDIPPAAAADIGLERWEDGLVLCMLMVQPEASLVTANLLGPLVVNRATGRGVQLVLSGSNYSPRHVVAGGHPEGSGC